ncbi:hypothetical protein M5689_018856 [Euphorbia peplus]|nr:hypothetical protein M5689_018856 [Euphorbia peplus]
MPPKGTTKKTAESSDNTEQETRDEMPHARQVADTISQLEAYGSRRNPSENIRVQQLLDRLLKRQAEAEAEERYLQQQRDLEERDKQQQQDAEDRLRKHKEESDERIRIMKEESDERIRLIKVEAHERAQKEKEDVDKRYTALVADITQGIKFGPEPSKETKKTLIVHEVVSLVDLTYVINKIPEKCAEILAQKSISLGANDKGKGIATAGDNKYIPPGAREENWKFNGRGDRISLELVSMPTPQHHLKFRTGPSNRIEHYKESFTRNMGGNGNGKAHDSNLP